MLSLEQGIKLINLARDSILSYFSKKDMKASSDIKQEFGEKRGAFVTLNKHGQLRGCIGFSDAAFPLYGAIIKAAQSAAFSDPRFPPVEKDEFNEISIEVSVLTLPSRIEVRNPEDLVKKIEVGKDGLIAIGTFNQGLLLPQVAVEQKWDAKTFLDQTCVKAGLPTDSWKDFDNCRIYKFQSEVFAEQAPSGEVKQQI